MNAALVGLVAVGVFIGTLMTWGWWEFMKEERRLYEIMEETPIKPTFDHAAMVNTKVRWISIKKCPPPRATKLLLIHKPAGVAVIGEYKGEFFTHWQALPVFGDDNEDQDG